MEHLGTAPYRTKRHKCLTLCGRDTGQPRDIHALIETVRAQAPQLYTTCTVPESDRAIAFATRYEPTIRTHCHVTDHVCVSLQDGLAFSAERVAKPDCAVE